jgi:hypothetical protein
MLEWEEYFEPHILERGRSFARRGAVKYISRHEDTIEAIVEGTEYYKVKIRFSGCRIAESYCSCPYAAGGYYCKHMAAALCEADTENEESYVLGDGTIVHSDASEGIPVASLISEANRDQLEEILIKLACEDDKIESRIRASLAVALGKQDVLALKKEIDNIFYTYSGRGNFIDYHAAMDFAHDLILYLENETGRLLDDGDFYAAFDISKYAYVKLGNWDIDDDGELTMLSACCYEIWQKVVQNCTDSEKTKIREWFIEHSEDGTVADYMEDVLKDFLRYELASKEELKKEIRLLDELIKESSGLTRCKSVFTCFYGYSIEAIEFRIILMKHLGADEKEIDDYRRKHMNFQSVRKYYMQRAKAENNMEEEIRLLNESKRLDKESLYLIHSYSERLIELYHVRKEYSLEKAERRFDFMSYQAAGVEDFRAYREMCSEEEWNKERTELIESRNDINKKCELMAEERMLQELFEAISGQEKKLSLFNKYGFLLVENHSDPILREYCKYVSSLADYARNRSSYDELIRYLRRMQQYKGGPDMVRELCREWINRYSTRKVMVQELRTMLR